MSDVPKECPYCGAAVEIVSFVELGDQWPCEHWVPARWDCVERCRELEGIQVALAASRGELRP